MNCITHRLQWSVFKNIMLRIVIEIPIKLKYLNDEHLLRYGVNYSNARCRMCINLNVTEVITRPPWRERQLPVRVPPLYALEQSRLRSKVFGLGRLWV